MDMMKTSTKGLKVHIHIFQSKIKRNKYTVHVFDGANLVVRMSGVQIWLRVIEKKSARGASPEVRRG